MAAAKVYKEKDANKNVLKKKTIAVIGYGALGRANALNLKDGGFGVSVGLRKGSASAAVAKKDGFKVFSIAEAVKNSDVILIAVPDMCQGELFETQIAPNLEKNKTLVFAHGLSVHWGLVKPPEGVDVILVAPKAPASALRSQFLEGRGVPAFIGVHSGGREARALALAWADAIGGNRPFRRAGGNRRRARRARSGGLRDARQGGVPPRSRVLRVLPRIEVDCRPNLPERDFGNAFFRFGDGEVRRRHSRLAGSWQFVAPRNGAHFAGNPVG